MPLDGKNAKKSLESVCVPRMSPRFFHVSYYPISRFAAQLGASSFGKRTKFSENGCVHDVTFEGTLVCKKQGTLPHQEKNIIGRKADKTAFSTGFIEIYLPNNGSHGIMESA